MAAGGRPTHGNCASSQQMMDERPMKKAKYCSSVSTHWPNAVYTQRERRASVISGGHSSVKLLQFVQLSSSNNGAISSETQSHDLVS